MSIDEAHLTFNLTNCVVLIPSLIQITDVWKSRLWVPWLKYQVHTHKAKDWDLNDGKPISTSKKELTDVK